MKKIEVTIREKDKGGRNLSLLNLREEVVNFLYKDTIANSTKEDLQFFVLLFFICIKIDNETFLEKILDDGIPKFNKLNNSFAKKKGYLRPKEYRKMIDEHGLSELFENDIFFVIIEAVLNIKEIDKKFSSFYKENAETKRVIDKIISKYSDELNVSFSDFKSSRIQDDRYDEQGNYHDLSKSVYRTIRMRNSRNLDLNLQKYTSIKKITSESPIDLTFFQHIDPQIIFDLWDKYHVAYYMKSVWDTANSSPILAGALGNLIVEFIKWKRIDGKNNRVEKEKAKKEFEASKATHGKSLDELTLKLVDSVLKANERLEKEIDNNRTQIRELSSVGVVLQDKEKIKKLEERVSQLENLSVSAKLIDDKKQSE